MNETVNPKPMAVTLYNNNSKSALFALIIQALGSHWLQREALFIQQRKKVSSLSSHTFKAPYDSSLASSLLVSCTGSASFLGPQLLEELVYGFDCDCLVETEKKMVQVRDLLPNRRIPDCKIPHFSQVKSNQHCPWVDE